MASIRNFSNGKSGIINSLPEIIQKILLDKLNNNEINYSELHSKVPESHKKLDEFQNNVSITDEIKLLVKDKKIAEAKIRLQALQPTARKQLPEHGEYYYQLGKIEELLLNYKEAYVAFKHAVNCQPNNIEYLNDAGLLGTKFADYEQAQQFLNNSLKLTISKYGEEHSDTANCYSNLSLILFGQGKYTEAEPLCRIGLKINKSVLGENHITTAASYNNLAMNLVIQKKYEEAEASYRKNLRINREFFGENHANTAASYNNFAICLMAQGKIDEAELSFRRSLDIRQITLPQNHPDIAEVYNNLASLLDALEKYNEAEPLYKKSLDIYRYIHGRPRYDKLSFNDFELVKIAAIHPDFM